MVQDLWLFRQLDSVAEINMQVFKIGLAPSYYLPAPRIYSKTSRVLYCSLLSAWMQILLRMVYAGFVSIYFSAALVSHRKSCLLNDLHI